MEGKLQGAIFNECGEWIWEQLQDEGYQIAGELIDLVLQTERELAIHTRPLPEIAKLLMEEFQMRGIVGQPATIDERLIGAILNWEEDFLGFAGISRAES